MDYHKKTHYLAPELTVISLEATDIITSSLDGGNGVIFKARALNPGQMVDDLEIDIFN